MGKLKFAVDIDRSSQLVLGEVFGNLPLNPKVRARLESQASELIGKSVDADKLLRGKSVEDVVNPASRVRLQASCASDVVREIPDALVPLESIRKNVELMKIYAAPEPFKLTVGDLSWSTQRRRAFEKDANTPVRDDRPEDPRLSVGDLSFSAKRNRELKKTAETGAVLTVGDMRYGGASASFRVHNEMVRAFRQKQIDKAALIAYISRLRAEDETRRRAAEAKLEEAYRQQHEKYRMCARSSSFVEEEEE